MKGQTTCPKCNHKLIMDLPEDSETCEIFCPKCHHKFAIRQISSTQSKSTDECGWEEHGEPRKTILSSLKPHTTKPMTASFLLLTSCVLGVFTAIFLLSNDRTIVIPYLEIDLNFLIDIFGNVGLSIVIIIFSCFAFIGFVATFKRRYLNAAVLGAFLGMFSIGFFIGFILCIIALALIILSREEFENATKGKVF